MRKVVSYLTIGCNDLDQAVALATGGSCEGPPGPRASYGEGYYLAYVRDPTGNKLSAFFKADH